VNAIGLRFVRLAALLGFAMTMNVCEAQGTGRVLFVDCSRTESGDGSSQAPWNSLAPLNAFALAPGDTVRLRRGSKCHGALMPQGSGTSEMPIRLTAYGEGSRPQIVADAHMEEAFKLFNQQYWEIDSLDIAGGTTYGVFISGDDGVLHHIHLSNLAVHDVMGDKLKHKESGLVSISPSSENSHFDDVVVEGVNAWHTNQWVGIMVGGGNVGNPPESSWSSNAVIRNSTVHDVQGDGIVLFRVRKGLIDSSVAWNIGMQETETTGTPNAIWTWMCNDCTVQRSEAYLTDSPGVDGGAFDIDYGNTKNALLDSYGHDTQGYCVAVFAAGYVTHDSLVRGNLCINNGRSPRMADYQGAIFVWTWNGGSIDGLTIEKNTVYWSPFENRSAVQNRADIKGAPAVFRNNVIVSTAPTMVESNTQMSLVGNSYRFFGSGAADWSYGEKSFGDLRSLQNDAGQENSGHFERLPLKNWPDFFPHYVANKPWTLDCVLPVTVNANGLIDSSTLQPLVFLKSFGQQYAAQGLRLKIKLISSDPKLFETEAFRNLVTDLDLPGIAMTLRMNGMAAAQIMLRRPNGDAAGEWKVPIGPVPLGLALRKVFGEPAYAQMQVDHR
jgi:hypothetical protein